MGLISELIVRLGWDSSAFQRGLADAEIKSQRAGQRIAGTLTKFGRKQEEWFGRTALGVFGAGTMARGFASMAENAAKISREAGRLGVTVEQFQAMQYAAQETGIGIDEITKNLKNLPPAAKEAMDSFLQMGTAMSGDEIAGMAQAHRNIGQLKASGYGLAGKAAGLYNWAGQMAGKGIMKTEALWQQLLGNEDYAAEIGAQAELDPADEEKTRQLEARLYARKQTRQTEKDAWLNQWYEDWDAMGAAKEKQESALSKAFQARSGLNITATDSLARIGGFAAAGNTEMFINLERQQIAVLERIAKVLEGGEGEYV